MIGDLFSAAAGGALLAFLFWAVGFLWGYAVGLHTQQKKPGED